MHPGLLCLIQNLPPKDVVPGGGDISESLSNAEIETALANIELPPNWEMRRDKRTGRAYFSDSRSKRTTWIDPRFLPENWDQRVDPATD